jgi:glucose/arabinose dehydrogenase
MLRIDVDRRAKGDPYAIPPDNPFADGARARPEIWAYGLRNPWRFSFDRETGDLFAGDVGQNHWEEIDIVRRGGNYGWRIMEGFHCTPKINPDCDRAGLDLPVLEYPRDQGVSVTGGYVYRGKAVPALQGVYLYADFGTKRVWGARVRDGRVDEQRELLVAPEPVSSFAEDRAGELYVIGYMGTIWRMGPR